jgi:hypothetical protein
MEKAIPANPVRGRTTNADFRREPAGKGKRRTGFTVMTDALPRERWILAGIVLFVVLGGLFPKATVIEHSSEIDVVDEAIHALDNECRNLLCEIDQIREYDLLAFSIQPKKDAWGLSKELENFSRDRCRKVTFVSCSVVHTWQAGGGECRWYSSHGKWERLLLCSVAGASWPAVTPRLYGLTSAQ